MDSDTRLGINRAKRDLEEGDPVEAVSKLDLVLNVGQFFPSERHLIEQAKEQADIGSPREAENLIWLALNQH